MNRICVEESAPGKLHRSVPSPADEANAQSSASTSAGQTRGRARPTFHKEQTPARQTFRHISLRTRHVILGKVLQVCCVLLLLSPAEQIKWTRSSSLTQSSAPARYPRATRFVNSTSASATKNETLLHDAIKNAFHRHDNQQQAQKNPVRLNQVDFCKLVCCLHKAEALCFNSNTHPVIDVQLFLLELQVCSQRGLRTRVVEAELQQFSAGRQRPALQSLEGNTSSQVGVLYTEQLTDTITRAWGARQTATISGSTCCLTCSNQEKNAGKRRKAVAWREIKICSVSSEVKECDVIYDMPHCQIITG